jgi:hypothetical protein
MLAKLMAEKQLIVHVLTVAAGVLGYVAGSDVVAQYPEVVTIAATALGAVNVVLHLFQPSDPAAK